MSDKEDKLKMEKNTHEKDQPQGMSKDDLHEVVSKALDHENVAKIVGIVDKYIDQSRSKKRRKNVINAIYVVAALLGFYLAWDATMNQLAANRINEDIKIQKAEIKKITAAMINVRKVRAQIMLNCKHGRPDSAFEQDKMRFLAKYRLIETGVGMQFDFTPDIERKIDEFIKFDESVKNVCAVNSPSSLIWRQYTHEIGQLMGKAIQENKKKLSRISEK